MRLTSRYIALALVFSSGTAAQAATSCAPKTSSPSILIAPKMTSVDPRWGTQSETGRGVSFFVKSTKKTAGNLYYKGDLVDMRGKVIAGNSWIAAKQWDCSKN